MQSLSVCLDLKCIEFQGDFVQSAYVHLKSLIMNEKIHSPERFNDLGLYYLPFIQSPSAHQCFLFQILTTHALPHLRTLNYIRIKTQKIYKTCWVASGGVILDHKAKVKRSQSWCHLKLYDPRNNYIKI